MLISAVEEGAVVLREWQKGVAERTQRFSWQLSLVWSLNEPRQKKAVFLNQHMRKADPLLVGAFPGSSCHSLSRMVSTHTNSA